MTWVGYYEFDGVEVINATRFETYARDCSWFHPVYRATGLERLLDDSYRVYALEEDAADPGTWPLDEILEPDLSDAGTFTILDPTDFYEDEADEGTYQITYETLWGYRDPEADDAPWYDPDIPESADFFGCYPINVTGMEDSSQSASVTQSTRDGGVPGRIRFSTKEAVFSLILAGASEAAVAYGMKWLSAALLGTGPNDTRAQGLGYDVRYLPAAPSLEPPSDSEDPYVPPLDARTRRRAAVTNGPSKTGGRANLSCGTCMWTVQFTVTFGDPFEYGTEVPVLSGLFDETVDDPFASGVEGRVEVLRNYTHEACQPELWLPLSDPLCPAIIAPPTVPSVALGCWAPPSIWQRYVVRLDGSLFPRWVEMLPVVTMTNPSDDPWRGVRLRWYADTANNDFDPDTSPCGWETDMVISYLPAGGVLRIDASDESIIVSTASTVRRADSVVFDTEGAPVKWPALTGGNAHLLVVDFSTSPVDVQDPPVLDVSLLSRTC